MSERMPTPTGQRPPSPRKRRLILIFIGAFLLTQICVPASYYVGDEPTSERFSWRMFSSIDLSTWDARVIAVMETGKGLIEQELPIAATLQETHVKTVQRAQLDIVEAFMRRVAARQGVREVRYEAQGRFPSGRPMPAIRLLLRPHGQLIKVSDSTS